MLGIIAISSGGERSRRPFLIAHTADVRGALRILLPKLADAGMPDVVGADVAGTSMGPPGRASVNTVHLLHHQVEVPGQRVARMVRQVAAGAALRGFTAKRADGKACGAGENGGLPVTRHIRYSVTA